VFSSGFSGKTTGFAGVFLRFSGKNNRIWPFFHQTSCEKKGNLPRFITFLSGQSGLVWHPVITISHAPPHFGYKLSIKYFGKIVLYASINDFAKCFISGPRVFSENKRKKDQDIYIICCRFAYSGPGGYISDAGKKNND